MKSTSVSITSGKHLNFINQEKSFELAKRLEEENYLTPYGVLKNWNLLRALVIYRPVLTFDYIYLQDHEPFDEN